MTTLEQFRARMPEQLVKEAQDEVDAAMVFANEHLLNRGPIFTGALLGLLVGSIFSGRPVQNFDQWAKMIRDDLAQRQQKAKRGDC